MRVLFALIAHGDLSSSSQSLPTGESRAVAFQLTAARLQHNFGEWISASDAARLAGFDEESAFAAWLGQSCEVEFTEDRRGLAARTCSMAEYLLRLADEAEGDSAM